MANGLCNFENCKEKIDGRFSEDYCIFHVKKDNYLLEIQEFKELIFEKIKNKDYNFRGYIFPGGMIFRENGEAEGEPLVIDGKADFSKAKFEGLIETKADFGGPIKVCADFHGAKFRDSVSFRGAIFSGGAAYFAHSQFSGEANFNTSKFGGGYADFHNTKFTGGDARFLGAQFSGGRAVFGGVEFSGGEVDFRWADFTGGDADFSGAKFMGGIGNFTRAIFGKDVVLNSNEIKYNIYFTDISISEKTIFYFQNPRFKALPNKGNLNNICLLFERIHFNQYCTYFEGFKPINSENNIPNPFIIFRYCQLKNVYFSENNLSLFSFYKSSFSQALFISSTWNYIREKILLIFAYKRRNVIPEEQLLSSFNQFYKGKMELGEFRSKFKIEGLKDWYDVAALYRSMKTALDNSKDYERASWFYYNEFEMKRKELKSEVSKKAIHKRIFSRLTLYNLYKIYAGYGEKPLWSFIWLGVFTIFFAIGHMVFGLEYFEGGVVETKYEFFRFLHNFSIGDFIKEFGSSFGYSISQAIPKNYIPYKLSNLNPTNPFGVLWSILNTVVLWILIIFIGIGLKRHFRRF